MKKKQYFGNEKGALSGIFVAFAAIALIPLCFVIFNYFWADTGSESRRQNDHMYGSNNTRLGTAQETTTNLDAAMAPTVTHCVADFAVRDANGVDDIAIPLVEDAPVNCISGDLVNVRAKIRQVAGADASSIGPYRVIKPSPKSGTQDFYVFEKYSRGTNTEGSADDIAPELGACFTGDTNVAIDIEGGSYIGVPIKYLREGDLVLGTNDDSETAALLASSGLVDGEKENLLATFSKSVQKKMISKVLIHREKPDQVVRLTVAGGALYTNKIHPFFVLGRGWINVKNFRENTTLISADGYNYPVTSAQALSRSEILYNLEVDGHTYFVIPKGGKTPLYVHNANQKANNPDL